MSKPFENSLADFSHVLDFSAEHILYLMNYEYEKLLDNTDIYIKDTEVSLEQKKRRGKEN